MSDYRATNVGRCVACNQKYMPGEMIRVESGKVRHLSCKVVSMTNQRTERLILRTRPRGVRF